MQSLPPNPAGPGPLEFLLRVAMGIISLVVVIGVLAFGAVIFGTLLVLGAGALIWVRWKAAKEGKDWKTWVSGRMNRGMRAGMRASWDEVRRSDAAADARQNPPRQDFYTTVTTIDGDYAVVEEESVHASQAHAQKDDKIS